MAIKYKYAWSGEEAVHIDSVLPSDRKGEYTCIGCGKALVPALGTIRQHHFRHKVVTNCSPETYLHKLAKEKFYETYKHCLDNGIPFLITFSVNYKCNFSSWIPSTLWCTKPLQETYDLTKYFSMIDIETPHGDFIPDILLRNTNGTALYLEMKVSHGSTQEKINSGTRIIEMKISCEEDIEVFSSLQLIESEKTRFFNFIRERNGNYCQGEECHPTRSAFAVDPSGASFLLNKRNTFDLSKAKNTSIYFEWIECDDYLAGSVASDLYKNMNAKAFQKGIPVKNCFLCRYHSIADKSGAYCKFLKRTGSSNSAVECQFYRPDPEVFSEYLEYSIEFSGLVTVKTYQ